MANSSPLWNLGTTEYEDTIYVHGYNWGWNDWPDAKPWLDGGLREVYEMGRVDGEGDRKEQENER